MFRSLLLFLSFSLFSVVATAQKPVSWTYSVNKIDGEEQTFELKFHAHINDQWHMYSQHLPSPDEGPLPTIFGLDENDNATYIGLVEEEKEKMHSEMDDAFGVMVNYFTGKVVFTQLVKLKSLQTTTITGFVSYMVCDNTMCLPPEDFDFSIEIEP